MEIPKESSNKHYESYHHMNKYDVVQVCVVFETNLMNFTELKN